MALALMDVDRAQHVAAVKERSHERAREIMPLVRLVAGASPVMAAVTQDENWNRYLGYLQGVMESWTKARDMARSKLGTRPMSAEELHKLNCDAMVAQATIEAFELAIKLPAAIMSGKEEADRLIKEFEKEEERNNANAA